MSEKFTCPTCHWEHRLRPGSTRTVSWADCACSDFSTCLHHQYSPEDAPIRPSEEVLVARLNERLVREREAWKTKGERCAEASMRTNEVADLRAEVVRLKQERGCPCLHTDPCQDGCTCVNPFSSYGCRRCATYGSTDQRCAAAERLAAAIDSQDKT